jgi:hypothetical protein
MGIFSDTLTIVAPVMGFILVSATFYINNLSGDITSASGREVRAASLLFFISFLGGGVLLTISIWESVSAPLMYWLLTLWIVLSVITGSLLTGRLAIALVKGADEIMPDEPESDYIPADDGPETNSPEVATPERDRSIEDSS